MDLPGPGLGPSSRLRALLIVEADPPTSRGEIEALFADPGTHQRRLDGPDMGHGRMERSRRDPRRPTP